MKSLWGWFVKRDNKERLEWSRLFVSGAVASFGLAGYFYTQTRELRQKQSEFMFELQKLFDETTEVAKVKRIMLRTKTGVSGLRYDKKSYGLYKPPKARPDKDVSISVVELILALAVRDGGKSSIWNSVVQEAKVFNRVPHHHTDLQAMFERCFELLALVEQHLQRRDDVFPFAWIRCDARKEIPSSVKSLLDAISGNGKYKRLAVKFPHKFAALHEFLESTEHGPLVKQLIRRYYSEWQPVSFDAKLRERTIKEYKENLAQVAQ